MEPREYTIWGAFSENEHKFTDAKSRYQYKSRYLPRSAGYLAISLCSHHSTFGSGCRYHHSHFKGHETEAQIGEVTCPRSNVRQ